MMDLLMQQKKLLTGNSGQQPEAARRLVFRFLSQSPDAMDCFNP